MIHTVLEAAVNGQAEASVTYNVREFEKAAERFGLRAVLPRQILMEMRDG